MGGWGRVWRCLAGLGGLAFLAVGVLPAARAAEAETLRVLTWARYLSPQLVERFQQETGIQVSVDVVNSYSDLDRPLRGGRSGYDVAFPGDFQVGPLIAAGLLERIGADRLPNFWNVDDIWRGRSFDPRNEYSVPHAWGTTAFAVDTARYAGAAASLDLLFRPPAALADKVVLLDSGVDMVQLTLVWLKLPRCSLRPADLDQVRAVLLPLLRRLPVVGADRLVEAMASGDHALAVTWNGAALSARTARPSLRYVNPREGALVWSDAMVVPRNAGNKGNALTFLSFMMRPDVAAMESNFNGYANMVRGSEAFMSKTLLSSPELIMSPASALDFFGQCSNGAERVHEALWADLKDAARR